MNDSEVRRFLDQSVVAVWAIDTEGNTTYVNDAMAHLLGVTPAQMAGTSFLENMSPEHQSAALANLERRRQGIHEPHTFRLLHAQGHEVSTRMVTHPWFDEAGEVVGAVAFVDRVPEGSARADADAAFGEMLARFTQQSRDCFWSTYVDSRGQHHIRFVSPGWSATWGYTAEALYARPMLWVECIVEEDRPRAHEAFEQVLHHGGVQVVVYRIRTAAGELRWIEDTMSAVNPGGGGFGTIDGLARDVTERQRDQRQRQAWERLQIMGSLIGGFAHDFNNLLLATLGNLELVRDASGLDEQALHDLDQALIAGRRAAGLCHTLLASSGQTSAPQQVVDLGGLAAEIVERTGCVSTSQDQDLRVRAEIDLLREAIEAMIDNALDASPDAAAVQVHVGRREGMHPPAGVEVGTWHPGAWVVIEVQDRGPGLFGEVLERAFDPYYTTRPGHRGLGLVTVCGVARSTGGWIAVRAREDGGASVALALPPMA